MKKKDEKMKKKLQKVFKKGEKRKKRRKIEKNDAKRRAICDVFSKSGKNPAHAPRGHLGLRSCAAGALRKQWQNATVKMRLFKMLKWAKLEGGRFLLVCRTKKSFAKSIYLSF